LRGREVQSFVEDASGAAAVANPRHGHDFLAQIAAGDGHASHHGNQIASMEMGETMCKLSRSPKWLVPSFPWWRIVLGHVLHEDVARERP